MTRSEPRSDSEVNAWIRDRLAAADVFGHVATETRRHRAEHDCDAYASSDGPLLGVLARACGARRILEIGTGLGYSALWLAHGAADARVETIERDESHVSLAREIVEREGLSGRITVHEGEAGEVAAGLDGPFELVFYDAFIPTPTDLTTFERLLRPGGVLVSSNLFLGKYAPDLPGLKNGASYRDALFGDGRWLTAFAGDKAVSVRS